MLRIGKTSLSVVRMTTISRLMSAVTITRTVLLYLFFFRFLVGYHLLYVVAAFNRRGFFLSMTDTSWPLAKTICVFSTLFTIT